MSKTTKFAMLHDWLGDPVDLRVPPDGLVERINHDHLEVLVSRVLNKKTISHEQFEIFIVLDETLNESCQIFKEIISPWFGHEWCMVSCSSCQK